MNTYYMVFDVMPTPANTQVLGVENIQAFVFAVESTPELALELAKHYLAVYNFDVVSIVQSVIDVGSGHSNKGSIGPE